MSNELFTEPVQKCSHCGSVLDQEDCPDYGNGAEHAGHVTSKGYWHPGPINGCPKCEPDTLTAC